MGWGLGLSVLAPFWNKPHWPVRLHSFVNLGKVVGYEKSESIISLWVGADRLDRSVVDNVDKLVRNPSVSVGLGIMYR
jgi:outer membrane protein insertion porin family